MIQIEREPPEVWDLPPERCHFCRLRAVHWHIPTNTAICEDCAAARDASEIAADSEAQG